VRAGKDRIITHLIGDETGWTTARSLGEVGATSVHSKPVCFCSDCTILDQIHRAALEKKLVAQSRWGLAEEFDILHFHIDQFHFPLFHQMADRTLTTLHGRQDLPDLKPLYIGFGDMPLVSISNAQRRPIAKAPLRPSAPLSCFSARMD
jgi:hypothetical protein